MNRSYYIILADEHPRFRQALKAALEEIPGVRVMGEAGSWDGLLELLGQSRPAMVIMDVRLPRPGPIKGTQLLKRRYPGLKVLITVMDWGKEYLFSGLAAGADGVFAKQYMDGEIFGAITAIRQGKIQPPAPEG